MKLTEAYIDIIINWWIEFLHNDIHSNFTADNNDNFKYNLNGTLSTLEFEPGEKLKIRVGLHEFLPNDNSLAKAFSVVAWLVGLSPIHFPHGAELEVNELYEIITCKNVGENPKNLPLINMRPVIKSRSFDSVGCLTECDKDLPNKLSNNHWKFLTSKKIKLNDPEYSSASGSPVSTAASYLAQKNRPLILYLLMMQRFS